MPLSEEDSGAAAGAWAAVSPLPASLEAPSSELPQAVPRNAMNATPMASVPRRMLGFMAGELSHLLDVEPRRLELNVRRTGHPEDANIRGFAARHMPDGSVAFVVTRS